MILNSFFPAPKKMGILAAAFVLGLLFVLTPTLSGTPTPAATPTPIPTPFKANYPGTYASHQTGNCNPENPPMNCTTTYQFTSVHNGTPPPTLKGVNPFTLSSSTITTEKVITNTVTTGPIKDGHHPPAAVKPNSAANNLWSGKLQLTSRSTAGDTVMISITKEGLALPIYYNVTSGTGNCKGVSGNGIFGFTPDPKTMKFTLQLSGTLKGGKSNCGSP